ncbi:killer cell lectin-like receptor subfamily G member 2 [Rhynchocyon petersi]
MEPAGPDLPMEPLGSRTPGPELGTPRSSPRPGAERRRPAPLRLPGLGYGAFRHPGALEPPGPAAELRDGDPQTPGAEPGAWAPVELQVDVRVTPVSTPGGRSPSPAPSTRFLTVPVPESPACARRAAPLPAPAPRSPLAALWDAERAGPADGSPGSPLGCCRCRELDPDRKEVAMLLPGAGGTKLPRAIALIGLPKYMKSLRWALAIMALLLAVSAVTNVVLASTAGTKCHPCPQGWLQAEEQCFYISKDEDARTWEDSQAFCAAHHATLPLLTHIQGFLSRQHISARSWVGARRGPHGWLWMDGEPLPPQLTPEDRKQLSCGGLEGGQLVALDCGRPRPWVCAQAA